MFKKISNKLFLLKQKRALLKEKKRLEDELAVVRRFPQFGESEEDNAQEVETFEGYKGLETGIKSLLKEVKEALARIDQGKYSFCEICQGSIEQGRLEAFPAARTCIACSAKKRK